MPDSKVGDVIPFLFLGSYYLIAAPASFSKNGKNAFNTEPGGIITHENFYL
jgi:hypothetical protein